MIPEQKDVNDSDNKTKSHDDDDSDSVMDYLEDTVVDQKDKSEQDLDSDKLIIPGIDLGTTNSCISIWRNNN